MPVGVLTTYHTQYTWDRRIGIFYLIFVTYLTGALYMTLCGSTTINTIIDNHRWHTTNSLERTRISCLCL